MKWNKSSVDSKKLKKIAYYEGREEYYPSVPTQVQAKELKKDTGDLDHSGLHSTSVSYRGLLNPVCKYAFQNIIDNGEKPLFRTNVGSYEKRAGTCEIQIGVNDTKTVFDAVRVVYDDKIVEAVDSYGDFGVVCYAKDKQTTKDYINSLKDKMRTDNQYRGKCLFFSSESIIFRDDPTVAWDDVIMDEKSKKEIKINTVNFLTNPEFRKTGINRRGLILYGPPGTGKTMLVKSLFNTLSDSNVTRIYATADTFTYPSVVGELFDFLKFTGSTALAFEDMDLISPERSDGGGRKVLGALLNNLDGIRQIDDPLVVIGTTNDVGMLDHALANRPCRFDRKIEVPLPADEQKKQFYNILIGSDVGDNIIGLSNGFSGAHIKEAVNTAKLLSAETGTSVGDCLEMACNVIRDNFFPMNKVASSVLYKNNGGKMSKTAQYMILTPLFLNDYPSNLLPLLTMRPSTSDITDKEATSLWNMWRKQEGTVQENRMSVNADLEQNLLQSLAGKEILTQNDDGTVSLTDKGKKILRSIILASEKNTFEGDKDKEYISMQEVHGKIHGNVKNKKTKCAQSEGEKGKKIDSDYYFNAIKDIG